MLGQRIVTALILIALLGGLLYFVPRDAMWAVFAVIVALAGWEWSGMLKLTGPKRVLYGVGIFVGCAVVQLLLPALLLPLLALSVLFWVIAVPFWLRSRSLLGSGFAGMALGALLLMAGWAAMSALHLKSSWLLLLVMALVWVADVCAYFAGRAFGRHKLAPTISPGKTWEGVGGAIAGVLAYGAILLYSPWGQYWTGGLPLALILLVALTGISVVGDLLESMIKRQAGVKDSSNLLPGHGGVLDRIDSLLSTLPVAALVVSYSA